MAGLAAAHVWVRWRASAVVWAAHARRLRDRLARQRGQVTSVLMVFLGLGGGLAGGALVGEWMLGLVLIAESCGLLVAGLMRDDGTGSPPAGDDRSLNAILERARRAP